MKTDQVGLLPTKSRRREPQGRTLVCGGSVRPATCYTITTVCLVVGFIVATLAADAAMRTSSTMESMLQVSASANAVLEPVAMQRDVVALALLRVGEVLKDPRVREMDIAGMLVATKRIEEHASNISASLDFVMQGVVAVLTDPRVEALDWPGYIATASSTVDWASETHLGDKVETGLTELDNLLLRLTHAAAAMAVFNPPPEPGST